VAEWFKAPVLKTGRGREFPREFESHPFRQLFGDDIINSNCNDLTDTAEILIWKF
jgi:hypothetical protein